MPIARGRRGHAGTRAPPTGIRYCCPTTMPAPALVPADASPTNSPAASPTPSLLQAVTQLTFHEYLLTFYAVVLWLSAIRGHGPDRRPSRTGVDLVGQSRKINACSPGASGGQSGRRHA